MLGEIMEKTTEIKLKWHAKSKQKQRKLYLGTKVFEGRFLPKNEYFGAPGVRRNHELFLCNCSSNRLVLLYIYIYIYIYKYLYIYIYKQRFRDIHYYICIYIKVYMYIYIYIFIQINIGQAPGTCCSNTWIILFEHSKRKLRGGGDGADG